jgi:4-amino-4-deoxy-L-arabinose transferase-like glycosyltransferase
MKWLALAGLLIMSFILSSYKLSEEPLTSHECFIGLTAREMVTNNDWVNPTCNGIPRLQKPPLAYWIVASFSFVTGEFDEFTVRAPGAFLAFLSVLVLFVYVKDWTNFRTAMISGVVWATSIGYLRHSHLARPDIYLMFFMLISMCSFYSAIIAESRRSQVIQMLIFWLSFALANLAKGPLPFVLLVPSFFVYFCVTKKWKLVPKLLPVIGTIIFLAIILPWPIAMISQHSNSLAFWKSEFLDRFAGETRKTDYSLLYYLPTTIRFLAPWSFFVICAFFAPFFKVWDTRRPLMRYIWIVFLTGTIIMSLNAGKRHYYIMPYFPLYGILIGIILEDMLFTGKAYEAKFIKNIATWHIAALIAGPVIFTGYAFIKEPELVATSLLIAAVVIPLALLVIYFFRKHKPAYAFAFITAIIACVFIIFTARFENDSTIARIELKQFCKKISSEVPAETNFYTFKDPEVIYAFYLNTVIADVNEIDEAISLYEKGNCIITSEEGYQILKDSKDLTPVYYQRDRYSYGFIQVDRGAFYKKIITNDE